MSTDRKVSTDALATLGTIIDDTAKRDAIHLAVYPAIAGAWLRAGQDVGFAPDGRAVGGGIVGVKPIGIVDPFLRGSVKEGARFWLVLYPRQISSLRHVWSHPAFDDEAETTIGPAATTQADTMMRFYAESAGLSIKGLIDRATDWLDNDEWAVDGGRWEGFSLPDAFWDTYAEVTGRAVPDDKRQSFFSCSC